jgi:hypothetical protein
MHNEEFQVVTAVLMKIPVSFNVITCRLVNSYWHFGQAQRLHLHGRAIRKDIFQLTKRNIPVDVNYSEGVDFPNSNSEIDQTKK